jgi:hypothetical protein
MKKEIVYYALGAYALYFIYNYYKKKMPAAPSLNVIQTPNEQTNNLMPSSPIQTDLAPGLSIVSDLINAATPTAPKKEVETYQTFYGESINGVKVGKVPMTC